MAKRYRPVDRDQAFLLPPDMRDWLPPEHPVWLVITVVADHLDTSAFHAGRRTGGAGAAAYDPDMLVTLLVWAYAHQVTSSRRIEALCRTDVAFKVICAGDVPDHVTIARLRADHPDAAAGFFASVLALCARLGMGRLGVVALDGTKIAGSASKSANRTQEGLRKLAAGVVAAHGQADACEDALFGAGVRGDEVPEDAWRPRSRASRIGAALASLAAERDAEARARADLAAAHVAAARAGKPRRGARPPEADVEVARLNLETVTAAQQAKIDRWNAREAAAAAAGHRIGGKQVASPASASARVRLAAGRLDNAIKRAGAAAARAAQREADRKGPGPVRNITDPDTRLMPVRGGGFIQGYNAQNVTSADELIIATEVTTSTTDTPWFEPMLRRAEDAAALITAHQPPAPADGDSTPARPGPDGQDGYPGPVKLMLADAGYLSGQNLTCPGPDRLIATGKGRDLEAAARDTAAPAAPASEQAITAMAARLATSDGITAYRQRGHIAETPHGHIKHNMAFRQLSMRGQARATAEWTLICAIHNIFKAITAGKLTTTTLATLPS